MHPYLHIACLERFEIRRRLSLRRAPLLLLCRCERPLLCNILKHVSSFNVNGTTRITRNRRPSSVKQGVHAPQHLRLTKAFCCLSVQPVFVGPLPACFAPQKAKLHSHCHSHTSLSPSLKMRGRRRERFPLCELCCSILAIGSTRSEESKHEMK